LSGAHINHPITPAPIQLSGLTICMIPPCTLAQDIVPKEGTGKRFTQKKNS